MSIDRRDFLTIAGAGAVAMLARTASAQSEPELEELTLMQLRNELRGGGFTARSLTEAYLRRIDALDKNGPAINAILELNPDALQIADMLDRERKEKGERGPLHGIPVLIKDNIDTADRMRTSAGSLALASSTPAKDAFIAERLRAA
ncbi:MAG TPA: amidase family protein, partial [Thermoanaerobaculia bacterium]|nr:amidase family protein [Thermoanaerobaculia bacterium]